MIAAHRPHHVGRKRSQSDIGAALAQLQRPRGGIGHDGEAYTVNVRPALRVPVIRIALEDDFVVLLQADETKWAGTDGMLIEPDGAAVGDDSQGAIGEIP